MIGQVGLHVVPHSTTIHAREGSSDGPIGLVRGAPGEVRACVVALRAYRRSACLGGRSHGKVVHRLGSWHNLSRQERVFVWHLALLEGRMVQLH